MSVIDVQELLDSRTFKAEVQTGGKFLRQYERKFRIKCSEPTDDASVTLNDPRLPKACEPYPNDLTARVKSVDVIHDRNVKSEGSQGFGRWLTATYSYSNQFDFDPEKFDENPLLRPPIWTFDEESQEKAIRFDLSIPPKAISNSAGCPVDPPITVKRGYPLITIQVNKPTFSYSWVADYQDCVNDALWNGFSPGVVLLKNIKASEKSENNVLYWEVTYTVLINYEGWRPAKVLDQGYYEKDGGGNKLTIRDKYGYPLPNPALLDGNGAKLPEGNDPVYLNYNINREIDFTSVIV